jgi:hypothetical protein
MLEELAKNLIQAKIDTAAGRPISVKLSIPIDGSIEQEKFLSVIEKLSSGEQYPNGVIVKKSGGSPHVLDDFLQALTELVGASVVEDALSELNLKQTKARIDADAGSLIDSMRQPLREFAELHGVNGLFPIRDFVNY